MKSSNLVSEKKEGRVGKKGVRRGEKGEKKNYTLPLSAAVGLLSLQLTVRCAKVPCTVRLN